MLASSFLFAPIFAGIRPLCPLRPLNLALHRRCISVSPLPALSRCPSRRLYLQIAFSGENPASVASEPEIREARTAVVDLLRESGASEEDALEIAAKAPKYLEMLIESVRELDELSLWSSWDPEADEDMGSAVFRRKVYLMAKKKGDGGIVPFLESIGLKQSSAMFVSRYLSSQSLGDLMRKTKCLKEMLFGSSGQEAFIGRKARRMMMSLSIPIDEDLQRTLSFYEKVEARRGGLDMLGYESTFPCIIESFPSLLSQVTEDRWETLVDFLELVGVPKSNFPVILLLFPPIILYDMKKGIGSRIQAIEKAGVKYHDIGRMLLKYPWILSTSIQDNYGKIIAFFSREKVIKSTVDLAIKSWPNILGCSTDRMKSIVKQFGELGVTGKMMAPVIASSPQLLLRKHSEVLEVISLLEEVGLDGKTIGRILCRCPEIFAASVDNTLRKKLNFLADFGISRDHLPRVIRKYPELLGLDVHNTLLPRMRFLMEIGLTKRVVCSMIVRFSPLLGYSIDVVMKPKLEFLLSTMQKPLKEIVEYPRYFSYSLDKKIKPRFWVLKSQNIECSLKEMLVKNNEEFAESYMGIGATPVVPSTPDGGG